MIARLAREHGVSNDAVESRNAKRLRIQLLRVALGCYYGGSLYHYITIICGGHDVRKRKKPAGPEGPS